MQKANVKTSCVEIGAFWLSLAATLQPSYNAVGAFTDASASNPAVGEAEFLASFGEGIFLCRIYSYANCFCNLSILLHLYGNRVCDVLCLLPSH